MATVCDKSRQPIANYLCCAPKGSIHLGVDDLSGEVKDCISQAKRMAERMTATGKERSFYLGVLDGAQTVAAAAAAQQQQKQQQQQQHSSPFIYLSKSHIDAWLATAGLSIYRAP
jgi:hypothetical protein